MADSALDAALQTVLKYHPSSTSSGTKAPPVYNPASSSDNDTTDAGNNSGVTPPPANHPDLPIRGGVINAPAATYA